MKRLLLLVTVLSVIFIVGCQQAVKEKMAEKAGDTAGGKPESPQAEVTGENFVDDVGNDLNNLDDIDRDLDSNQVGDLDSDLLDIEDI